MNIFISTTEPTSIKIEWESKRKINSKREIGKSEGTVETKTEQKNTKWMFSIFNNGSFHSTQDRCYGIWKVRNTNLTLICFKVCACIMGKPLITIASNNTVATNL